MKYLIVFAILIFCTNATEEDCARSYLNFVDEKLTRLYSDVEIAEWNFHKNLTRENHEKQIQATVIKVEYMKKVRNDLLKYNYSSFKDPILQRQTHLFKTMKDIALPIDKVTELTALTNDMKEIYSSATIENYHNASILMSMSEIIEVFQYSYNPAELRTTWQKFADAVGPKTRELYPKFVEIKNEEIKLLATANISLDWMDSTNLKHVELLMNIMSQVKPLYLQLHAFVRFKLKEYYEAVIPKDGCIPAHLLGDIICKDWQWISRRALPLSYKMLHDLIKSCKIKRSEVYKMSENFYTSLGMPKLPSVVWEKSIFVKSPNSIMQCHTTIFYPYKAYRMLDCDSPDDLSAFPAATWCLGGIYFYLQSEHLNFILRTDLYDITIYILSDLLELSSSTKEYLSRQFTNLKVKFDYEENFNNLLYTILKFLPSIPTTFVLEEWRKGVFTGSISVEQYNSEWWRLMHEHLGVEPPINRRSDDFDPAINFKISYSGPVSIEVIGRIVAHQLHKELCIKVGQYNINDSATALHECCLYDEKLVGELLMESLKVGKSKPWTYILEVVTGSEDISVEAFLEYYEPLRKWLVEENEKNSVYVGWGKPRTNVTDDDLDYGWPTKYI